MKALDCDTPILTTWGWKRHGDIRPGDFVFGPDGNPKLVLANTSHDDEESYEIEFDDGTVIVAGAGHLWEVERDHPYGTSDKRRCRKIEVVTTTELIPSTAGRTVHRPDRIRLADPVNLAPKRLLIDPYLLGAWIGDGATDSGVIYAADQDIGHFGSLGRIAHTVEAKGTYKQAFHRIAIEDLQVRLRVMGLLGNKHIPDDYLEASIDQRWELLRGLMDTDGCATKQGHCTFWTKIETVSRQVFTLAASLSLKPSVRSRFTMLNGKRYGPHYQITFTAPSNARVFNLKRKQDRLCGNLNERSRNRYVTAVRSVGKRIVNCITVEGHLYLAGKGFVTTHNSMCANVFWPAWEWGPKGLPTNRFIAASYSQALTLRDNVRFRNVIMSPEYRAMYGHVFGPSEDQFNLIKVGNNKTGWKLATSVGGVGTGERADRFVIDDGNSVKEAESEAIISSTNQWFLEVVPTRLNDARTGVIVNIQQRTAEDDISGTIKARELDYDHLLIRMEHDSGYDKIPTSIGWVDPREEDGELAWPERFPQEVVDELKETMGPYAVAGQFQQSPEPRGGGILKREYWQAWEEKKYPECSFVIASLDPAFSAKKKGDPSGFTIWGVFLTKEGFQAVLLLHAARLRLDFCGPEPKPVPGETYKDWKFRTQSQWGLVETVHDTCLRFGVDCLLIENKASGISVIQTLNTLLRARYKVETFDPKSLDKIARMIRVQPEFSAGEVYAPYEDGCPKVWAVMVIDECASTTGLDDLTDSTTQAIYWLRASGILERREEQFIRKEEMGRQYRQPKPLYNI